MRDICTGEVSAVCSFPVFMLFCTFLLCSLCCSRFLHAQTHDGRGGSRAGRSQLALPVPYSSLQGSIPGVSAPQWVALPRTGIWKWLWLHYHSSSLCPNSRSLGCSYCISSLSLLSWKALARLSFFWLSKIRLKNEFFILLSPELEQFISRNFLPITFCSNASEIKLFYRSATILSGVRCYSALLVDSFTLQGGLLPWSTLPVFPTKIWWYINQSDNFLQNNSHSFSLIIPLGFFQKYKLNIGDWRCAIELFLRTLMQTI